MSSKPFYQSKTFWTNVIGALWFFIGPHVGIPTLDGETMAALLVVINLVLRAITKQPLSLTAQ